MAKKKPEEELELQPEEEDEEEATIEYDIATYPSDFTLQGISTMWQEKDITIPEFQREFVWSIKQSSLLIESFLLGLPVPPVFFYIDDENKNLVIDGQQRILSAIFYFDGYFGSENLQGRKQVFRLKGLSEDSPFHNKAFSELPDPDQRKLRNAVLRAINIRQVSPTGQNTSIYHIFERLNTGGTALKPQEIRNCVFRGKFIKILRKLNGLSDWRGILGKNGYDKHQRDIELILRIFALSNNVNSYEKPMKEFLNLAMKENRNGQSDRVQIFERNFPLAAEKIVAELGLKPFHIRGPLNTSVLDSIFCTIADNIEKVPDDLTFRFKQLLQNKEFLDTTYYGTSDVSIVRKRFSIAKRILIE